MSLRSKLWGSPEEYTLTSHQKGLVEQLSSSTDHEIVGEIGAGKTFAVRRYLRSNDIPHEYLTATEVLEAARGDRLLSSLDGVDVVVIDNFDVIPLDREYLEPIHEQIEMELSGLNRSVWIILPSQYNNDWFDTVTQMMTAVEISRTEINRLTTDEVVHNLQKISDGSLHDEMADPARKYGYHTIINSFQ